MKSEHEHEIGINVRSFVQSFLLGGGGGGRQDVMHHGIGHMMGTLLDISPGDLPPPSLRITNYETLQSFSVNEPSYGICLCIYAKYSIRLLSYEDHCLSSIILSTEP